MPGKVSGRIKRAITSSLVLFALAGVLALSNVYVQNRDRGLALQARSEAQHQFFASAVDRPDISVFFKNKRPAEKVAIVRNLARYNDPKLVKLAVIWLTDFDVEARKELGVYLVEAAPKQPKALAEQLAAGGGFQKLAVANALKTSFDATLPYVIDQLAAPGARANAVEYLVSMGQAAASPLLAELYETKDKDVKLAAADALGKIGVKAASGEIRRLYQAAEGADKSAYLASMANLGDPASLPIYRSLLLDKKTTDADRASAILGLGRIASPESVSVLWQELDRNPLDRRQIIESLSLAGDKSLAGDALYPKPDRLEVAGGIRSEAADAVIRSTLGTSALKLRAAELAEKRPRLVQELLSQLARLDLVRDGRMIEVVIRSLLSTPQGQAALDGSALKLRFKGFIERERAQAR